MLASARGELLPLRQATIVAGSSFSLSDTIARQSVSDLWLTGIDIVGAGESIEINGRTTLPERVPQYLQKLSSEKVLSGTELKVFRLERPDEGEQPGAAGGGRADRKPKPAAHVEFTIRTAPVSGTGADAVQGAPR